MTEPPRRAKTRSVLLVDNRGVALLADVSTDYYTRLEKGNLTGVSEKVLDAGAHALHLDDVERAHLFNLARTANTTPSHAPHYERT